MEVVCSDWCSLLREQHALEASWKRLCQNWYPSMAARLDVEQSPSASPALLFQSSPVLSAASPELSSCSGGYSPEWKPLPEPWHACAALSGSVELEPSDALTGDSSAYIAQPAACHWRVVFQRRFLRQLAWDADKRRSRRNHTTCNATQASSDSSSTGREKLQHAARTRACKRCGVSVDPRARQQDKCKWHPGKFLAMDEQGEAVKAAAGGSAKDFERRAQNLIKAQNRKKTSKKANAIVFGAACDTGVAHEDGVAWRWSCCGEENLVSPGCAAGPHQL
eukprot:TRINITY_DN81952_c0_g1_i1.p1 TRINITY_DN81952_c0_g1~~TRINITY_DN81952_c0_g1_i1.p1  ORF type:complete len:279 (+),score=45.16 TRINITY_DN81952_c0_g1_i1:165-1001(+)